VLYLLLAIAILYCAFRVMSAVRLLNAAIWLALTSALVSLLVYILGAPQVAVIELSVGAGLVTVLFVFAFSIVGEATVDTATLIPRPLVILLIAGLAFVLGWFIYPMPGPALNPVGISFGKMLWGSRGLDVIAQVVLIFSGVLGLIGLLSEGPALKLPTMATFASRPIVSNPLPTKSIPLPIVSNTPPTNTVKLPTSSATLPTASDPLPSDKAEEGEPKAPPEEAR
jgi:uncharacterized MnhB-related membrane protein